MTRIYWFYLTVALLVACPRLPAAEQAVDLAQNSVVPVSVRPGNPSMLDRFESAFSRRADNVFTDQFQTLDVAWRAIGAQNNPPEVCSMQSVSAASHALSRSILYGLHEATGNLPVVAWLEADRGFLATFVRSSVESVEADTALPQETPARFSAQSWWKRQLHSGALAYGVRPFRSDPYAFLSWGLKERGDVLLATHVRYYCRNLFDHKFEFCLAVPLARQFSFDFGASYQFGRHDDERRVALRLLRAMPGGTLLHVGVEFRMHPEVLAGISIPI